MTVVVTGMKIVVVVGTHDADALTAKSKYSIMTKADPKTSKVAIEDKMTFCSLKVMLRFGLLSKLRSSSGRMWYFQAPQLMLGV